MRDSEIVGTKHNTKYWLLQCVGGGPVLDICIGNFMSTLYWPWQEHRRMKIGRYAQMLETLYASLFFTHIIVHYCINMAQIYYDLVMFVQWTAKIEQNFVK